MSPRIHALILPFGPRARFAAAALGWLCVVLAAGGPVAGAIFVAASGIVVAQAWHFPHSRIGLCNVLTMGRLALGCLLAERIGDEPGWPEVGIALAALASDGVDGFAARRAGLVSRFGARFDMEIDSALGFVLSCLAVERVGLWVLMLGLPRYLWLAAGLVFRWLPGDLPESRWRKAVCVLQIGVLVAVICPALPAEAAAPLAAVAGAALVWSFGRDAIWRARHA